MRESACRAAGFSSQRSTSRAALDCPGRSTLGQAAGRPPRERRWRDSGHNPDARPFSGRLRQHFLADPGGLFGLDVFQVPGWQRFAGKSGTCRPD